MTRGRVRRVTALERERREWEARHVRRSDIPGFLFAVLSVVGEEAGADVGARVGRGIVEYQAGRVLSALQGKTAAEREALARRVGLPLQDLAGLSAPELARLSFEGAEGWPA